jgi:hypothetical protein
MNQFVPYRRTYANIKKNLNKHKRKFFGEADSGFHEGGIL